MQVFIKFANIILKIGKYVVLVFYPYDFTYVCPTELVAFSNSIDEFNAL